MSLNENRCGLSQDDEACAYAMLLSSSHVLPMVIKAAVQLNLFEIIAQAGPGAHVSAAEIVAQLPNVRNPDAVAALDRMLRLLATHSLLSWSTRGAGDAAAAEDGRIEKLYGLSAVSKYFLRSEDGGSVASLSALSSHRAPREVWLHMEGAILEGGNQFKKVHGMSIFEYMDVDPTLNQAFNRAMADHSKIIMRKILEVYNGFDGVASLVDVGGGHGACLNMVISKYPSIKGINFDLPHVVKNAPPYLGIEHVGGSMLSVGNIPKADVLMIKDTLHNWNDENCIKALKNCYEALPEGGKLIVMDVIMPELPEPTTPSKYISQLDNIMLMQPGGRERTEKEFEALCKASGFLSFQVACCACSLWVVMEFYK